MIGALTGTVFSKKPDSIILMVGGVGYLIYPPATLHEKTKIGVELTLYTHTHVREDALSLFGFTSVEEMSLFELLLSVSGIGPKTALSIVDRGVAAVRKAVGQADVGFFTSVPRLGTRGAQKVIIELKPKLGSVTELNLDADSGDSQTLVEALTNLGFTRVEAKNVLPDIPPEVISLEEKIRLAVNLLGKA